MKPFQTLKDARPVADGSGRRFFRARTAKAHARSDLRYARKDTRDTMHQSGTKSGQADLTGLPLLPGQAHGLRQQGIATVAQFLRHPEIQGAIHRILSPKTRSWDPQVLRTPLTDFLSGPGVDPLQARGCSDLGDLLDLAPEHLDDLAEVVWHPLRLLQAIGVGEERNRDPRLDHPLAEVSPSTRARRACRTLGIGTIGEFLQRDRSEFLALKSVGAKTYQDLAKAVEEYLKQDKGEPSPQGMEVPLAEITANKRAHKAFQELGLVTVGHFLATPKERFLALRNFGERTWYEIRARIQALAGAPQPLPAACPQVLLDLELDRLPFSGRVQRVLIDLGLHTLGDLFATPKKVLLDRKNFGPESWKELGQVLTRVVRRGLDQVIGPPPAKVAGLDHMVRLLMDRISDPRLRTILTYRAGLAGKERATLEELGGRLGLSRERVRQLAERTREDLHRSLGGLLDRLAAEVDQALQEGGGMAGIQVLADLPLAQGRGNASRRAGILMGLARFFHPQRFHQFGRHSLTTLGPDVRRALVRRMRRSFAPDRLPRPLADLEQLLVRQGLDPAGHLGLACHLARKRFGLEVVTPHGGSPLLDHPEQRLTRRLARVLEARQPLTLGEIQAELRRKGTSVPRRHLRRILHRDRRFAQAGPDRFILSGRFQLPPEERNRWLAQARQGLLQAKGPAPATALLPDRDPWQARWILKGSGQFRSLGRGLFAWAERGPMVPTGMARRVQATLDRAGGTLPAGDLVHLATLREGPTPGAVRAYLRFSRDLALYPDGRIGFVKNHPIGQQERSRLVTDLVDHLKGMDGYARLPRRWAQWRRQGLLPPGLTVPPPGRSLPAGRADPPLRYDPAHPARLSHDPEDPGNRHRCHPRHGSPLSLPHLLAERPELGEFEECLAEILRASPW